MDPSDLLSTSPLMVGGRPVQTTLPGELGDGELMARVLAVYPSKIYQGWTPPPPSPEAAAAASPLMQIGLSQLYPDLFGRLAPAPTSDFSQDQDDDHSQAPATLSSVPAPPSTTASSLESLSPPQPLQLGPATQGQLTPAPQLANANNTALEFAPTYLGVPGAAAFGRIGLTGDNAGYQSLGGLASPGHATPGGQILRDGQDPTAAVNVSSPSADEISVKPVVQDGRLQMAIYDDTTREKWVVDSTPGQSATVRNAKGEPIYFTSTDLTEASDRPASNAFTEFGSGMADSEADQNTFSLRPGRGFWGSLGYQESKPEAALGLAAPVKDLAVFGAGKLAAIAGIRRAAEEVSLTGPVVFRHIAGATREEMEQLRAYVDSANEALKAGRLSPTGRVAVTRAMRNAANKLAKDERLRAAQAGTPYKGVVGHGPDMTWTGDPQPHRWIDMHRRVNSTIGSQSRWYPRGFKPTVFQVEGE